MEDGVEVTGRYINSMVKSVAAVSPVFERKMDEMLSEYGIDDPDPEEWYPAQSFVQAATAVTNDIGAQTIGEVGRRMGRDAPKPPGASPHEALQSMHEASKQAYRGGTDKLPAGTFVHERLGPQSARMGVTERFPYPEGIARGSIEGVLKDTVEQESSVYIVDADPGPTDDPALAPEQYAYEVNW